MACVLEGTRPLLLEIQALVAPTDLAMPRRVATGVDPKRLAMIVAVLGRHARLALGSADVFVNVAGGVRIDEPGADLAIALAVASAAKAAPVRDAMAAFGEIGLTGRLRPATQAERRLAECAKLGLTTVVRRRRRPGAPGTLGRGGRAASLPGRDAACSEARPEQGFCASRHENAWKMRIFDAFRYTSRARRWDSIPAGFLVNWRQEVGLFEIGEKVVYPHHGAGTIVKKEKRTILGEEREYLTIQILHNDMTVNVPTENAEKVGLRKVIDEETVELVLKALTGNGTVMPKNWNRRFKHNREKMKTGDIFELAEVVRNLSLRDQDKGLSTGEKQMFVKAKKILVSELMYAKQMDEDETADWLDGVLADADKPKKPRVKATA